MFSVMQEQHAAFEEFEKPMALCLKYDKADVFYLLSRRGNALEIHMAADGREGKKHLREASRAIVAQIPKIFPWCEMLIAPVSVKTPSVYNHCKKVGFTDAGVIEFEKGQGHIMTVSYG